MERSNLVERTARGDRIDEQESLSSAHVLLPHRTRTPIPSPLSQLVRTDLTRVGRQTYEYSSCPAVSNTSRSATSSSIMTCLRYESASRKSGQLMWSG